MPPRQQRRAEEARATRPLLEAKQEALEGYQRWEFHATKQFVRRYGWLEPVKDFVNSRAEAGLSDAWKYLTLPGKDALDVGLLYREGLLEWQDDRWPTLAICDRQFATLVVSRIGQPMMGSIKATIEEVIHRPDHRLTSNFPYEVINLDYCGPLLLTANHRLAVLQRVAAMRRIFALQRRCAFLLLLTTQDGLGKFSRTARDMMKELLRWNIDQDEQFRREYGTAFGSLDVLACSKDFVRFAQLIVPKVVADCAREWGYEVKELFAGSYLRLDQGGQSYRMICHTFEIDPVGRSGSAKYQPDPRLSQLRAYPSLSQMLSLLSPQERQMADASYKHFIAWLLTRNLVDVTDELEKDKVLRNELTDDAEGLRNWWRIP